MTLHVGLMAATYVLQVGDRLVSRQHRGGLEPLDPASNKTIFLRLANGELVLSYAGLATINGRLTDEWLLETITGQPLYPGFHSRWATTAGGNMRLHVGGVVSGVIGALESEVPKQPHDWRARRIEILITGWTWPRRNTNGRRRATFGVALTHDGKAGSRVEESRLPRIVFSPTLKTKSLSMIGACDRALGQSIIDRLGATPDWTPDDAERVIVEAIRSRATPGSGIGADLMSIMIPQPGGDLRACYWWDEAKGYQPTYLPAIVTPGMVVPPSVTNSDGWGICYPWFGGSERCIMVTSVPPQPVTHSHAINSQSRMDY